MCHINGDQRTEEDRHECSADADKRRMKAEVKERMTIAM